MQNAESLKTQRYLQEDEIKEHLEGVEYIVMAAPSAHSEAKAPIHFTFFLNTADEIPHDIQEQIFMKFCKQFNITHTFNAMSALQKVGFAVTNQDTPMPMHLYKEEDQENIPHTTMHIIDFEGHSPDFDQVTTHSQTGWTYAYEA